MLIFKFLGQNGYPMRKSKQETLFLFSVIALLTFFTLGLHTVKAEEGQEKFSFKMGSKFGDRDIFNFEVTGVGTIKIDAAWRGTARQLTFILNGPAQKGYYARKDGKSPLTITFEVTPKILKRGSKWNVSIANFSRQGQATGSIRLSYPRRTGVGPKTFTVEQKYKLRLSPSFYSKVKLNPSTIETMVKFSPLPQIISPVSINKIVKMKTPVKVRFGKTDHSISVEIERDKDFFDYDFLPDSRGTIRAALSWKDGGILTLALFAPGGKEGEVKEIFSVSGKSPLHLAYPQKSQTFSGNASWLLLVSKRTMKELFGKIGMKVGKPVSATLTMSYPHTIRAKPGPWLGLFLSDLERHFRGQIVPGLSSGINKAPHMKNILQDMLQRYKKLSVSEFNKLNTLPTIEVGRPLSAKKREELLKEAVNQTIAKMSLERMDPGRIGIAFRKKIPKITEVLPQMVAPGGVVRIYGMNFAGVGIEEFVLIGIQRTNEQTRPRLVISSPDLTEPIVSEANIQIPMRPRYITVHPYAAYIRLPENAPAGKYELFIANEHGASSQGAEFWVIPEGAPPR